MESFFCVMNFYAGCGCNIALIVDMNLMEIDIFCGFFFSQLRRLNCLCYGCISGRDENISIKENYIFWDSKKTFLKKKII